MRAFSSNRFFIVTAIIVCVLMGQHTLFAQTEKNAGEAPYFDKYGDTATKNYSKERPYYLLSSQQIPAGVTVVRPLAGQLNIIRVNNKELFDTLWQYGRVSPANETWKFSSFAEKEHNNRSKTRQQFILVAISLDELLAALSKFENKLRVLDSNKSSNSVLVETDQRFLDETLLHLKEIVFIDKRAEPKIETSIIGYNRSFHGINAVDYSIPGANGKNIVVGVKEQKMEEADLDLFKRVKTSTIAASTVSSHATVIASIIGGAGNSFYDGRGIANAASFFPSSFANLFADDATVLNSNKVSVQNHSYGTVIQQFYGAEAVSYDVNGWQNKNIVHVFSAGNQGTAAATGGVYANIAGYANVTGNFKMAKNIITVAAIDNKSIIPAESSSGPLYDGRIAPQLTALGPNGTSDAAAMVSGTVAVLQQVYADSNSQALPAASLIKAILYNTAEDIYRAGLDYKTGYGLLNSFAAVKAVQQKEYDGGTVTQGQQWIKAINVPSNAATVKVTLAWTDSAAIVNNNRALINDLDLELVQLSNGAVFKPWVLSTAANADSLAKAVTRKRDSLNTAEQISIPLPVGGNYEIRVTGFSANNNIPFHVSFHVDTLNTFRFTSPQHTSDVNREENADLDIRWKTFVADTNTTGNLSISYDNGANWQNIKTGHKIYTNYYKWPIKDTASRALFRMQTPFGDFYSKEFVISPVNRLSVDFLCADSFRLSWNKHVYANGYRIYTLIDSAYLKPILDVVGTFKVFNRAQYPSKVYAVEPLLSNGLSAARSVAIDISLQGTKCFYKTFYFTLFDQNKLDLIVELGAPDYVDSLSFEQVSQSGVFIRNVGNQKVGGSASIYHQLVNDPPQGASYWRVRIKLKSGAVVHTEIIEVQTSGQKFIVFYPNPVSRNQTLNYVLQQGIPGDSRLQLFDMTGRLLRTYTEMPGTIKASTLPAGVLIYKLVSRENAVLETGKIILLQ